MSLERDKNQLSSLNSYLINLESRPDRLISSIEEAAKLTLNLIRIDAVSAELEPESKQLLTPYALACWNSHKKVLSEFLKSEDSHCLILEDDFFVKSPSRVFSEMSKIEVNDWDFIQIGFLNTGLRDRMTRYMSNLETSIFRIADTIGQFAIFRKLDFNSRLRIQRLQGVPKNSVPDDIRSGAHCYIVSKFLAQTLISLNNPAFLTADGLYSALAWDKSFKMIRLRKSVVSQSNSPSSIKVLKSR